MSKGGAQAPPQVNVSGLIGQQTGANIQTAETQAGLNNANTTGPLGSSYWQANSTDPNTGLATSYTQNQNLSPAAQNVFNNQTSLAASLANTGQNVGNIVSSNADNAANTIAKGFGQPLPTGPADYSNLAALPTSATDFSNEVKQAQNAAYNAQTAYLDPQFKQKQSDLTQQMADQGISAGSDAFDRSQGDLGRQETLAYQQAQNAAVQAGNEEQARLFGENLSSRQEGVNEANTQWEQPFQALSAETSSGQNVLSNIAAALSGLGSLGNFTWASGLPSQGGYPTGVAASNISGLQSAANQANANSFAANNTINNQALNGIGSLGGVLGNAFGLQSGWLSSLLGGGATTGAALAGGATADAGLPLGLAALGL